MAARSPELASSSVTLHHAENQIPIFKHQIPKHIQTANCKD
jgi:hypothetical protein